MDGELIEVNRDIHKGKKINIAFDILHIVGNSSVTLLRTGKILTMDHMIHPHEEEAYVFSKNITKRGSVHLLII